MAARVTKRLDASVRCRGSPEQCAQWYRDGKLRHRRSWGAEATFTVNLLGLRFLARESDEVTARTRPPAAFLRRLCSTTNPLHPEEAQTSDSRLGYESYFIVLRFLFACAHCRLCRDSFPDLDRNNRTGTPGPEHPDRNNWTGLEGAKIASM